MTFRKDIINYRNINLVLFFNNNIIFFIINIYSDKSQTALKYFEDIEVNIDNILIMTLISEIAIETHYILIIQYKVIFSWKLQVISI